MVKAIDVPKMPGQFKNAKGRIVEVYPVCSKNDLGTKTIPDSIPYRTIYTNNRIMYGWLTPSYELKPINDDEKILFTAIVEDKPKSSTSSPEKRKPSFSIFKYVIANISKTEEEIVEGIKAIQKTGVNVRCKDPTFIKIVTNYKKYIVKKGIKE